MAWLDTHRPVRRQFTRPRRHPPSGVIVVHTAENVADDDRTDLGAEQVARFIQHRSTPGSYHWLVDSDSRIQLVDLGAEAYGERTGGNRWAVHLSFACRADQWSLLSDEWRQQAFTQAAMAVVDIIEWLKARQLPTPPLERIGVADYRARRPGFIGHGDIDPDRRTDPGVGFDWPGFFGQIGRQLDPPPMTDQDIPTRIVAAYLRGGRPPEQLELHDWLIDCTKKRLRGRNLESTFKYIEWAVRSETS